MWWTWCFWWRRQLSVQHGFCSTVTVNYWTAINLLFASDFETHRAWHRLWWGERNRRVNNLVAFIFSIFWLNYKSSFCPYLNIIQTDGCIGGGLTTSRDGTHIVFINVDIIAPLKSSSEQSFFSWLFLAPWFSFCFEPTFYVVVKLRLWNLPKLPIKLNHKSFIYNICLYVLLLWEGDIRRACRQ